MSRFEITVFSKRDGPLTKRISLAPDGSVRSDRTQCKMARGTARRAEIADMQDLGALIDSLKSGEALGLGTLRADLPDQVEIVTKRYLDKLNGVARPDVIARTGGNIVFRPGQPALALLDFDTKGMPSEVAAQLEELGGYWAALVSVLPELASAARVTRRSTSAGLSTELTRARKTARLRRIARLRRGERRHRYGTLSRDTTCPLLGRRLRLVDDRGGRAMLESSIVDRMVGRRNARSSRALRCWTRRCSKMQGPEPRSY